MSEAAKNLTVSCIICFHREGLLAHTTLHSIARARALAEAEGISVQCVMTLDNHDDLTERSVMGHPMIREGDIMDVVNYGDAGLSRNHAIKRSNGEYIIIVDGDDLCSDNFVSVFTSQAALDAHSIFFPEYILSFGLFNSYVALGVDTSVPYNMYALFAGCYYCSRLAARRDVFEKTPFVYFGKGFGYEDWHWVCEVIAKGLKLRPAPEVVLFYRRRLGSRLSGHERERVIIPPSKFFEMLSRPESALPTVPPPTPAPLLPWNVLIKEILISCLQYLPDNVVRPLYAKLKALCGGSCTVNFPPAIQKALLDAAAVDGALHPHALRVVTQNTHHYDALPGMVYAALWHELESHDFDVVYVVPHLGEDEAGRITVRYMESMHKAGKKVLCLLTGDSQSDRGCFSAGTAILSFLKYACCLRHQQQQAVLVRLLVQLAPPVIHIVHDETAFELIEIYGNALKKQSKLLVSVLAESQDALDIYYGTASQYLRCLIEHCGKIVTDNMVTAKEWHSRLGIPLACFQPIYGIAKIHVACAESDRDGGKRVLWAGRLDREKRLDILLAIAKELPDVLFDVRGQSVLEKDSFVEALAQQANVTLCGGYQSFCDLPTQQYAAFVYTTQSDGLPNVLLEAAACGLPLIAPDRGGISDFVSNETGRLIPSHTDVDAYVCAIQAVLTDPGEALQRAQRAQDLLRRRHTREMFTATLMQVYGF